MRIRKKDERGFTLIEVIVTLMLVGVTAALAGMWIVSLANGYMFTKKNMDTTQKAQLAMTRLAKEFTVISSVTAASANTITYIKPVQPSGSISATILLSGTLLQIDGNTLTDDVSAFALAYCDDVTSTACPTTWSSTSRIIVITLTLKGANNVDSTFTQRIAPRNL